MGRGTEEERKTETSEEENGQLVSFCCYSSFCSYYSYYYSCYFYYYSYYFYYYSYYYSYYSHLLS